MKPIKSQIYEIYKEIINDNNRDFSKRLFRREYLGSLVINYYDKKTNKLMVEIHKSKKGVKFYLNDTFYFLQVINGITIIYNEYGKAISITYSDGYEWLGETFVSQEAILEEDEFRMAYQKFIQNYKISKDLRLSYNQVLELLAKLDNITCICDMSGVSNKLNSIKEYLEHCIYGDINYYFDSQLNSIKNVNNEMQKYTEKTLETDNALKNLEEYYNWVTNIESLNINNLDPNDSFLKIIKDFQLQCLKMLKNDHNTQNDWDLIEYYHYEIDNMISNRIDIITKKGEKQKEVKVEMVNLKDIPVNKEEVKIEYVDLNDEQEVEKPKHKFRLSKKEKADYLTWKSLNEFAIDSYHFDADRVTVKEAKKHLKKFSRKERAYKRLIKENGEKEIGKINYEVYNTIKEAKDDLVKTEIIGEKTSEQLFMETLRNNNERKVYKERQEYLEKSATAINKIKKILVKISDENFAKIENNYKKVKRRAIGFGAGLLAGVLAVTSFGVGSHKFGQKNTTVSYSDEQIDIYNADNQKLYGNGINETVLAGLGATTFESEPKYETNLVGIGETEAIDSLINEIESEKEALENDLKVETETESETISLVNEIESEKEALENDLKAETETESETISLVNEIELEEELKGDILTELEKENETEIITVENETEIITVENETEKVDNPIQSIEGNAVESKLSYIEDEKGLLETYKAELQNLEASLPQSNITFDDIRSIGSEINVTNDAKLQNDEYSLILDADGKTSIHKDNLPRVICSVVMTDGNSGITAKSMEEVESLVNQGYYVAGYGVLNPYSKDINNIEGFFETEDVYGLVRK